MEEYRLPQEGQNLDLQETFILWEEPQIGHWRERKHLSIEQARNFCKVSLILSKCETLKNFLILFKRFVILTCENMCLICMYVYFVYIVVVIILYKKESWVKHFFKMLLSFFYVCTTIYMYIILILLLNNYNNVRVYHKERRSIYYGKKLNL